MQKGFFKPIGVGLILVGALSLIFNLAMPWSAFTFLHWTAWRLWPLAVISVGGICLGTPFLSRDQRALGSLFVIFGMLTLTTGSILFLANLFDDWNIWAWLWPLNVLSLALGFFIAAVYSRSIWLVIPAIIVGMTGLVLQFCALTGMWTAWAMLWPVEPLAVGLALLVVGFKKHLIGLFIAGFVLCGVAGIGLVTVLTSVTVLGPGVWLFKVAGPVIFMLMGSLLLAWKVCRRSAVRNLI